MFQSVIGGRQSPPERDGSVVWIDRLRTTQIISIIVGLACIPGGYAVMILTRSAIATVIVVSGVAVAGLICGLCEVAKGIIEANAILKGRDQGDY